MRQRKTTISATGGIITILVFSIIIGSSGIGLELLLRASHLASKVKCLLSEAGLREPTSALPKFIVQKTAKIYSPLQVTPVSMQNSSTGGPFELTNRSSKSGLFNNLRSSSYAFSLNGSEFSTPNSNDHTGDFGSGNSIAVVDPTFTAAAYGNHFYTFYSKYSRVPKNTYVDTDLGMLSATVTDCGGPSASAMHFLEQQLKWVIPGASITTIGDEDVDAGKIFKKNGDNAYNVIVLGHQEYVTQQEYDNLRDFVAMGGTMIVLDGNVFYVQVNYDRPTHTVTLVKGHGWAYNGKAAWRSVDERWADQTEHWVGSNYLCFSCQITFPNNPFGYRHHEEQYLTNRDDIVLLNYNATLQNTSEARAVVPDAHGNTTSKQLLIATYELNYQKGKVIALGIYSDDIISDSRFDHFLDGLMLKYAVRTNV